jgi:ATP-dependent DNA helicase RecQ
MIPVSCFTATAKQIVIDDIRTYFKQKLNLELILFTASAARKNLHYRVVEKNEDAKIEALRGLLDAKPCPTIVYVSRTKKASELAERLTRDGYPAKPYHGKMDKKEKSENQDSFLHGESRIMVATSAFGMGVDKKDIGLVVHYDISDSLENYAQEAGRAGRDQQITADCYVLFNDEDLNKHFLLLNQTRISQQEIQQVWKAIKDATRTRSHLSRSALEIAREAGWDQNVRDVETRVKTAIAALEEAGYVKRGQNMPRVYADSILARNAMEAIEKIRSSPLISAQEQEKAIRIIKKLIASRSRLKSKDDAPQSRIDCIADDLGLEKHQVLHSIQLLREAKILADSKDLTAYLDETGSAVRSMHTLASFRALEAFLLSKIPEEKTVVHIKEINECAEAEGLKKVTPNRIQTVVNFWTLQGIIKREVSKQSQHLLKITFQKRKEILAREIEDRGVLAGFILEYLEDRNAMNAQTIEFSVLEIKEAFNQELALGKKDANTDEVEQALFYLSRIGSLKLDGGFLVTYNGLSIERLILDNKIKYKAEDYQNLKRYYDQKTQMIHIVGEYARKMMENYQTALQFVEDYFQLEYSSFLRKYFKGSKGEEIRRNLTPEKFRKIFGELSVSQLKIINDKESQYIVVAAGPGSGKTKTLVHKLASLLLMEDVKHEQLLMVTFSRAAATEFKKRLQELIGNAAHFMEIKTFHSYCFDLLGRVGNLEKSVNIVEEATNQIRNGEVESSKITKTVLVIDEAQDIDEHEFALVQALIRKNDDMRVIAVGDDDQNIFAFRGSDSKYMQALLNLDNARLHELVENYRSRRNLVEFSNILASTMKNRLKTIPIMPVQHEVGQIRVIRYECGNLVVPVVTKMLDEGMKGSTCIMTKTNDEALQVCSLIQQSGVHAKLMQSMERYDLHDLLEVRFFLDSLHLTKDTYILHEDVWEGAKGLLKRQFVRSRHLPMCLQMIQEFEATNKKFKYISDLLTFIHESQEEDFLMSQKGSVFVSTMHKSKGREFDHVVLMLNRFSNALEESKRLLYVAMTRARQSLTVHCNDDIFGNPKESDYLHVEGLRYERDSFKYEVSNRIIVQLTYKDVHLDFFFSTQHEVRKLVGGDTLAVDEQGCLVNGHQRILRFSKKFQDDIMEWQKKGYRPCAAVVNHILYWKKDGEEEEILVLFPEMMFLRES